MKISIFTMALLAAFAMAAATAVEAQTYDGFDNDTPAEWEYGVDLDGK